MMRDDEDEERRWRRRDMTETKREGVGETFKKKGKIVSIVFFAK